MGPVPPVVAALQWKVLSVNFSQLWSPFYGLKNLSIIVSFPKYKMGWVPTSSSRSRSRRQRWPWQLILPRPRTSQTLLVLNWPAFGWKLVGQIWTLYLKYFTLFTRHGRFVMLRTRPYLIVLNWPAFGWKLVGFFYFSQLWIDIDFSHCLISLCHGRFFMLRTKSTDPHFGCKLVEADWSKRRST